ncbi:hypothetical protein, partial [Streptomyces sp. NPDC002788]
KGSWEGKHDKHGKPHGGMHTGGGALAAVNADDDWGTTKHEGEGKHDENGKHEGHGKGSWEGKHDKHGKPHGGMHTGGGALAAVNADDNWDNPKHDSGSWGDKQEKDAFGDKRDEHKKGSWKGKHDKPRGGMHTGGGALAGAPGVTAGGLAVLAVAGTGLYALRRQKASQGAA